MSTSPSSLPERSLGGPPPSRPSLVALSRVEAPGGKKTPDIRRQAIAAIEALMALSGPESARERAQLKAYVEAHPEQPEVALAKHLLALRPNIGDPSAGEWPDSQSSNAGTAPDRNH
jgi:hypothetical protein